jgi:hypothetical protein
VVETGPSNTRTRCRKRMMAVWKREVKCRVRCQGPTGKQVATLSNSYTIVISYHLTKTLSYSHCLSSSMSCILPRPICAPTIVERPSAAIRCMNMSCRERNPSIVRSRSEECKLGRITSWRGTRQVAGPSARARLSAQGKSTCSGNHPYTLILIFSPPPPARVTTSTPSA